jgi:hypothetical protein
VDARIEIAVQKWSTRVIAAIAVMTFLAMTPVLWTAIVAYQYQHAAIVASGLFVFARSVSIVIVVVWSFADQTSPDRLPKMDWIRSAWIEYLVKIFSRRFRCQR